MDTSTLLLAHRALTERSIRGAARAMGRPAGSVAAALRRLEAEISVPLAQRAGASLTLTLEAERLGAAIAGLAERAAAIEALGERREGGIGFAVLERFDLVAQEGSIRRAARRLGLGQPQLTRQIAHLEQNLGIRLLARGTAGSVTTEAGLQFAVLAREIAERWETLAHAATIRFKQSEATVRLGSIIPLGPESEIAVRLARLAARWLAERPRQPLFVSSTTAEDLLAGLKAGRFDAAFLDTAALPADFEGHPVGRTRLALVGMPEAMEGSVADVLKRQPIAVPSSRSGLRQTITRLLAETLSAGEREQLRVMEIDSLPVILNLVRHHGFVSVLPESSVRAAGQAVSAISLADRHDLALWLVWSRTPAGRRLGQAVLEML